MKLYTRADKGYISTFFTKISLSVPLDRIWLKGLFIVRGKGRARAETRTLLDYEGHRITKFPVTNQGDLACNRFTRLGGSVPCESMRIIDTTLGTLAWTVQPKLGTLWTSSLWRNECEPVNNPGLASWEHFTCNGNYSVFNLHDIFLWK